MNGDGVLRFNRGWMSFIGVGLAAIGAIGGTYITRVVNDTKQDQQIEQLQKDVSFLRADVNQNRDAMIKAESDIRELKIRMRSLDHQRDDDPPRRER